MKIMLYSCNMLFHFFWFRNGRCENTLRKVRRKLFEDEDYWEEETHFLNRLEFNQVLCASINELPEKWRLVLTSKYFKNLTAKQICQ